jgi:hypothetical protein
MKLVELLAKELKVWPEGGLCDYCCQSDSNTEVFFGHPVGSIFLSERADETEGVTVSRAQWQAERDRQKGGEWKRHRGGRQPVDSDVRVEVRLRCGDTQEARAHAFLWPHTQCDSYANIMSYRVISKSQAEEVDTREYRGPFPCAPIGEPENAIEFDIEFPSGAFKLEAQVDQIDGPIKWRDAIVELEAREEDIQREIASLHKRLTDEGFQLIRKYPNDQQHEPSADMSNWRNWKAGDLIEMTADDWCDLSRDAQYDVESVSEEGFVIVDDLGDKRYLEYDGVTVFKDGRVPDFKFIRRP